MLPATIVDTEALWQTVAASVVAGLGVTLIFSLTIWGATRYADLSRDDRPLAAFGAGLLMTLGAIAFVAALAGGIVVMADK